MHKTHRQKGNCDWSWTAGKLDENEHGNGNGNGKANGNRTEMKRLSANVRSSWIMSSQCHNQRILWAVDQVATRAFPVLKENKELEIWRSWASEWNKNNNILDIHNFHFNWIFFYFNNHIKYYFRKYIILIYLIFISFPLNLFNNK